MHSFGIGAFDKANVRSNIADAYNQISKSIRNIASGVKHITDDPVAVKISDRLRTEIDDITLSIRDAQDEMGMLELARSKTLVKVDVMQRIRELAVAYNNDTLSDSDRRDIQEQVDTLAEVLNDDYAVTRFASKLSTDENGVFKGLSGNISVTEGEDGGQVITISDADGSVSDISGTLSSNQTFIESMGISTSPYSLGQDAVVFGADKESHKYDLSSEGALSSIDKELERYSGQAASLTAKLNAMDYHVDFLTDKKMNMQSWYNDISSTDIAEETVNLVTAQLQAQLGQSLLEMQNNLEKNMVMTLLTA